MLASVPDSEPANARVALTCPLVAQIAEVALELRLAHVRGDDDVQRAAPLPVGPGIVGGPFTLRSHDENPPSIDFEQCFHRRLPFVRAPSSGRGLKHQTHADHGGVFERERLEPEALGQS